MTQTISQQNKPSFTLNCKEEEESWDDIEFPDSGLFYTNNNEKDYGLSTTTRDMSGITIHDSSDDDSSEGNNCDESTSASSTSSSSSTNNSINKVKEMMINRGVVATNDKDEFSGLITRLVGKNNKVLIGDDWDNDMEIPEDGFANLTITSNNNIGGKRSKSRCSSITVTSCNNITNKDYYDFDSWNEEEEDDDKKIVNDNDFITSPRQLVIKRIEDPSKVFSTSKDTKGKSVESFDDDFDFSEVDLNRLNLSAEMLKFYQESDHEVIDKDPFGSEKLSSRNSSRLSILPSPAPTNSSQSAFESGEEEELFDDLQFPEHMDSLTLSPHLKPNSTNGNDVHDTINYKDDDDDDLENGLDIEDESAFAPDKLKNKNIITRPSTTQSKRTRRESFTIEFAPSQIINNLSESDHLTATQELRTPDITSREELLYCKSSSSESTVSITSTLSKDSRPSTPLPSKTAEASTRRHPSPITFVKNKVYPNTGGKKSNNGDNNSYRNIHSSTPPVSSLHRLKTNKVFSKSLTSLTTTTTASTSNFKQNASSKSQKNPKSPNLTVKGVIPPNNNNTTQVKAKRSIITNTTNSTNNKTTSKKTAIGNTTSTTSIKTKSIKANCSTLLNKHNNNNNNNKNNNNRPMLLKTNPMPSSFNNLNNLHALSKRRFQQNTTFNTTSTLVDSILEIMRKPRRQQSFGDGTELDVFDDLPVNLDRECSSNPTNNNTKQDRKNSTSSAGSNHDNLHQGRKKKNRKGKKPQLIRNLNLDKNTKAVGEMVYNPITQRWDGNESVLKEFDNANSPTRPALISNMNYHSTNTKSLQLVGNMKFDPTKMCWNNDYSDDDAIWDSDSGNDSKEKEDIDSDDFCNFNSLQAFSDNDISYSSIKIKKNRLIHQNRNTDSTGGDSNDFQVGSEFDITPGFKAALLASERQHRNEISRWYPGALSKDNDSRFGLRDVTLQRSYLYELRNNKPSSGNNSKINHDRSGGLFEAAMNLTRHERRHFR